MGSVGYVAPEQIENRPIDARADVYSLGCVLYECLAGTQPYPRDTEMATLYAHVQAPPPSLAEAPPGAPAGDRRGHRQGAGQGSRGTLPERRGPRPGADRRGHARRGRAAT